MDMDKKWLSMNDVVHLLQDRLDEMLNSRKCSCADLARIITMAGFPVTERTLKDYLARARKDAKEGNTAYSELRERILSQAAKEDGPECTEASSPFLAGEDGASDSASDRANDARAAPDDFATSSVTDGTDAKEMARQHVQDVYAGRKRRKKVRLAQKRR